MLWDTGCVSIDSWRLFLYIMTHSTNGFFNSRYFSFIHFLKKTTLNQNFLVIFYLFRQFFLPALFYFNFFHCIVYYIDLLVYSPLFSSEGKYCLKRWNATSKWTSSISSRTVMFTFGQIPLKTVWTTFQTAMGDILSLRFSNKDDFCMK